MKSDCVSYLTRTLVAFYFALQLVGCFGDSHAIDASENPRSNNPPGSCDIALSIPVADGLSVEDQATLNAALTVLLNGQHSPEFETLSAMLGKSYTMENWANYFYRFFSTQGLSDPLMATFFYPVWSWGAPAVRATFQEGMARAALKRIAELTAEHAATLPQDYAANATLRRTLFNLHAFLANLGKMGATDDSFNAQVFASYECLLRTYPGWFGATATLDHAQGLAVLRAQVWMAFSELLPLTPATKARITRALGLRGRLLDIWERFSLMVHDNNGLQEDQKNAVYNLLDAIPQPLLPLRNITFGWLLSPDYVYYYNTSAVNSFHTPLSGLEPSFPSDFPGPMISTFMGALSHEANHIVDHLYIENNPSLRARRQQLLQQLAGKNDLEYLRDYFGDEFFQESPQEFVASIANDWFTDSQHTLELGLFRFERGYRLAINQALFFAELYSLGGDTSKFYQIRSDGIVHVENAPLSRDGQGRIIGLTVNATHYTFSLDADGNVVSYFRSPN